jgi:RNA-binding protein NOB1
MQVYFDLRPKIQKLLIMDEIEAQTKALPNSPKAAPEIRPAIQTSSKPNHTIILDSSPLLLNTPTLSTLLSQSHMLVTTKSVISEIRDPDARSRIENLYLPFLNIQSPKPESIKHVKEFARKTGDAGVLSATDIGVLALAYDLECERNGGDWRLRQVPGQKRVNGAKPVALTEISTEADSKSNEASGEQDMLNTTYNLQELKILEEVEELSDPSKGNEAAGTPKDYPPALVVDEEDVSSDSDSEGWITPSNIKKYQAKDANSLSSSKPSETKTLQVATISRDFAMQNVLLQMNLNLLSPKTCKRITQLRQTILRCHGCFNTTKEMDRQFCPRCGKPTLTRVSCTTNAQGEVKLHLKANMQWNNKGNVFSIPKPVSGRSNQKWTGPRDGGGKSGWGRELVLAEDQREYVRAMTGNGRQKSKKEKDLMDEDYLPSILSGERSAGNGRIRIGGGRNINATKRWL